MGRDQLRPMQRLVRIMAVLDAAGAAGALRDRLLQVADYGEGDPGSQLALDLKHLRSQGWQIDNIASSGEVARYRMVTRDNRLHLQLSPAQIAALQQALLLAERSDLSASLGVAEAGLPAGIGTQVVPPPAARELTLSLEAVRLGSRLTFTYKGITRRVDPGTVRFQNSRWYLSGVEVGDEVVKHFVISRMSDAVLDRPGTARPVPQVQRIPLHPLLWEIDEPTRVVVRAPGDYVPDVERWLRHPDAAWTPEEDWVEMAYTVTNRASFRARLYVLGTRISIVEPEEFRAEVLAELRTMGGR